MDGWNNKNEEKYVFHRNSKVSGKVKVQKKPVILNHGLLY